MYMYFRIYGVFTIFFIIQNHKLFVIYLYCPSTITHSFTAPNPSPRPSKSSILDLLLLTVKLLVLTTFLSSSTSSSPRCLLQAALQPHHRFAGKYTAAIASAPPYLFLTVHVIIAVIWKLSNRKLHQPEDDNRKTTSSPLLRRDPFSPTGPTVTIIVVFFFFFFLISTASTTTKIQSNTSDPKHLLPQSGEPQQRRRTPLDRILTSTGSLSLLRFGSRPRPADVAEDGSGSISGSGIINGGVVGFCEHEPDHPLLQQLSSPIFLIFFFPLED